MAEFGEQGASVDGALVGVVGSAPLNEFVNFSGESRHELGGGADSRVDVLVGDLDGNLAVEWLPAGDHLVQHDSDRVDVTARVGLPAQHEFGGEVRHGADQSSGAGRRRNGAGQPEIAEFDSSVVGDQNVLGFDVPVDEARFMGRPQALDDGVDIRQG